jgi:hypothetical protein
MSVAVQNMTYLDYLVALNFRPDDLICASFGRKHPQPGQVKWEDFFQPFAALSTPKSIAKLTARNEDGQDIYLSLAAFQPGTEHRKKEFVSGVRHLFVDIDENGNDVLKRIREDVAAGLIPEPNILVGTSPGKGQAIWSIEDSAACDPIYANQEAMLRALQHRYHTDPATIDTARVLRVPGFVNNKYAERPVARLIQGFSKVYQISDFKIEAAAAPKPLSVSVDGEKIPYGQHDSTLFRIACKLRQMQMEEDAITAALIEICEKRCEGFGSDYREMCQNKARQACRYEPGKDEGVLFNGVPGDLAPVVKPVTAAKSQTQPAVPEVEIDTTGIVDRPVFPYWVLNGTTIGEGLVKPTVATSSKHAEFLFLPAVQLIINYLFGRVRMESQTVNLNMFIGLVSPYGKFFKSSSCELVHEYFKQAGILVSDTKSVANADGKVLVTQAGSTEGFGKRMTKINCKHAVLYNDELGKFVSKAGIESSSFTSDLLSFHGSGEFGNVVKSEKDSFIFESGTYCFSWLWCTTDRGFERHWPRLAGISTGLEDRMFFVLGPEKPKKNVPFLDPQFRESAIETRKAIDAAVSQGVYKYEFLPAVQEAVKDLEPRAMELVQILALYFAVDLKEQEITNECVDRALALVKFRNDVIEFLAPIEAANELARLQKEIRREIRRNNGQMKYRDLCRKLNYQDYGSDLWGRAMVGLIKQGDVFEFEVPTPSAKRKTHMIALAKQED